MAARLDATTLIIISLAAALVLLAWLGLRPHKPRKPRKEPNPAPKAQVPRAATGVPPTLSQHLHAAADDHIPVVLQGGSVVPASSTEGKRVAEFVVSKTNARGARLTVVHLASATKTGTASCTAVTVTSATKTVDAQQTTAYDLIFVASQAAPDGSVGDVSVELMASVIVAADGTTYLREVRPTHEVSHTITHRPTTVPTPAQTPEPEPEAYEAPTSFLAKYEFAPIA